MGFKRSEESELPEVGGTHVLFRLRCQMVVGAGEKTFRLRKYTLRRGNAVFLDFRLCRKRRVESADVT